MVNQNIETKEWDIEVTPKANFFNLNLKEVWKYRDLLSLFIKREIVQVYKQTILGPLWFFIQPVLTTIVFTIIFGSIAQISTDGKPATLFYLSGILLWTYFADAINNTSNTFTTNAA
ncbi:MAG: ABC transporter permease, partial [Bacteroidetes bacterium]|nr:ABC transporter permease [Bacteroidota bacterium]